jgi:hypothetical protein
LLLGDRTLWTIRNATKVEVFRILPPIHQQAAEAKLNSKRRIAKCIVISKGRTLDGDSVKQLSSALLTAISSDPRRTHTGFVPGTALRLWSGDEAVNVAVCFQCNNMSVMEYSQAGTSLRSFSYLRSINSIRPLLVKQIKAAFPNDRQIQKIQEVTGE